MDIEALKIYSNINDLVILISSSEPKNIVTLLNLKNKGTPNNLSGFKENNPKKLAMLTYG